MGGEGGGGNLRSNRICKSHTANDICGKAQIPQEKNAKKKIPRKKKQIKKQIKKPNPQAEKANKKNKTNPPEKKKR